MNVYLSSQSLKVGTRAEPESNRASDQDMVSKSADEVQEKHTGRGSMGGISDQYYTRNGLR